jgi:hypothetical protein
MNWLISWSSVEPTLAPAAMSAIFKKKNRVIVSPCQWWSATANWLLFVSKVEPTLLRSSKLPWRHGKRYRWVSFDDGFCGRALLILLVQHGLADSPLTERLLVTEGLFPAMSANGTHCH